MSLVPRWAHASAILGLKLSVIQAQAIVSLVTDKPLQQMLVKLLEEYESEIARVEGMKD